LRRMTGSVLGLGAAIRCEIYKGQLRAETVPIPFEFELGLTHLKTWPLLSGRCSVSLLQLCESISSASVVLPQYN